MSRKFLLATVLFLSFTSSAFAGKLFVWELVYSNDANGATTYGDINELISAVKNGADVKVMLHSSASGDWYGEIDRTNISPDNIVTAYFDEIFPNSIDPNDVNLYHRLISFTTTGVTNCRYLENSNLNWTGNYPLSWFVKK